MIGGCPICSNFAEDLRTDYDGKKIKCLRCGEYDISGTLYSMLKDQTLSDTEVVLLSAYIRNNQKILLGTEDFSRIIKNYLPKLDEKIEIIMLIFEKINPKPGAIIDVSNNSENYLMLQAYSYIIDDDEWNYILKDYIAKELNYIKFLSHAYNMGDIPKNDFRITPSGWRYIDSVKVVNQNSNTAFIAMWFNNIVKPVREIIKQAIRNAGYEPKIVDEEPFNGDVVNQIITYINQARFVIADLTEQRQGVYFEAGYAKGLNIPIIYSVRDDQIDPIKEKGKPDPLRVHFDLNHQNLLSWNNDNLVDFQKRLTNQITATIGVGPLYKGK